jgi:hypothetical protein
MRKLLLSLMVLATLASCGKDNAVNGGANTIVTNPVVTGNTSAQDLVNKINNPSTGFGTGRLVVNNASTPNCKEKWIFTYCTTSSSSANQTTTTWNALASSRSLTYQFAYFNGGLSKSYSHSSVVVATKQKELTDLLNSATNIYVSGTTYTIMVSNTQYIIDTQYPIQANPIRTSNDYLYNAI